MEQEKTLPAETRAEKSFPWKLLTLFGCAFFLICLFLLVTLVVPNVFKSLEIAQQAAARAQLAQLGSAVEEYALLNGGRYPDSLNALVAPDVNGNIILTAGKLPLDPWKQSYLYTPTEGGSNFVLETLGKDGKAGGTGDDEDLRITSMKQVEQLEEDDE